MAKNKRNPAALKIADLIFENYDLKNANDAKLTQRKTFENKANEISDTYAELSLLKKICYKNS